MQLQKHPGQQHRGIPNERESRCSFFIYTGLAPATNSYSFAGLPSISVTTVRKVKSIRKETITADFILSSLAVRRSICLQQNACRKIKERFSVLQSFSCFSSSSVINSHAYLLCNQSCHAFRFVCI